MRDRNKCNPQLGQRRLAIGGNGDRSRRFGSGMVRPFPDTGGSTTSLSVADAWRRVAVGDVYTGRATLRTSQPANILSAVEPVTSKPWEASRLGRNLVSKQ